jgi:hypothetical protein
MKVEAGGKRVDSNAAYWVLATLAEAWTGLGDEAKAQAYQSQALALNPPPAQWMVSSTQEQLNKLRGLLADAQLKHGLKPDQAAAAGSK